MWTIFREIITSNGASSSTPQTSSRTSNTVTYYKLPRSPQLLAKRIANRDDLGSAMTLSEFLARAWRAANIKARELGWIV
jgi:hypothetical protein